jgi:signal transducing adaptor molecule
MPTRATASRVRAIYPFVTHEKGELSFEKGDVIKVIDRMYDEWYTGAVGGRIGIFPVSYVVSWMWNTGIVDHVLNVWLFY